MSQSKRTKGSVAAFLFMPQFHLCFEGFAHIVPVFMRTLALMFVQAQLIPNNHPATRYGAEGVEKYGFSRLMGEAWFTLRTTRANPYQWGMFLSIIMMIAMLVCAVGSLLASTVLGAVTTARAQIFTHPADPYGVGNGTGMDAVPAGTGANTLFDTRYPVAGGAQTDGSTDYALFVLDRVLRQGAIGEGGTTQSALQAVMQTYNSGVMIVAAVLLFWMILSIVVDTAKSGQLGGGRHNMVWAPIRIVFALGIMIPLGSAGFSSGQFMVLKLAEWGSNFGSTVWGKYVGEILNSSTLLPDFTPKAVNDLANGIVKVKTCQVAYNASANETITNILATGVVLTHTSNNLMTGKHTNSYTNHSGGTKCGTIWFSTGSLIDDASMMGQQVLNNPAVLYVFGGPLAALAGGSDLITWGANLRRAMQQEVTATLNEGGINPFGGATAAGATSAGVYDPATLFACRFVGRRWNPPAGETNPVLATGMGQICNGVIDQAAIDSGAICGATAVGPDADIKTECHQMIVNHIIGRMDARFDAFAAGQSAGFSQMISGMTAQGWGGMGMWYQMIATLVKLTNSAEGISAGFTPGTMWKLDGDSGTANLQQQVASVMQNYDDWWQIALTQTEPGQAATPQALADRNKNLNTGAPDKDATKEGMEKMEGGGDGSDTGEWLASLMQPGADEWFLFDVLDGSGDSIYPMSGLVNTGDQIMAWGAAMMLVLTVLQTVSTMSIFGWTAGPGFSTSALVSGLTTISFTLMVCGMVLSYYLPVIPLIRVAFAVVTWIISVFEAVVMVPIAALAHLTSEGDGLAGGARGAWILWLNILMRPVLVVFGFIGAMLVFNTFIVYFQNAFGAVAFAGSSAGTAMGSLISKVAYTIIYIAIMYTAANTIFKMLDTIPNALMRWMGGQTDPSFDNDNSEGMLIAGSNLISSFKGQGRGDMFQKAGTKKTGADKAE